MIPKAFLPSLPPLVAVARQASNAAACEWMLTETRLWWVTAHTDSTARHARCMQGICTALHVCAVWST